MEHVAHLAFLLQNYIKIKDLNLQSQIIFFGVIPLYTIFFYHPTSSEKQPLFSELLYRTPQALIRHLIFNKVSTPSIFSPTSQVRKTAPSLGISWSNYKGLNLAPYLKIFKWKSCLGLYLGKEWQQRENSLRINC